MLGINKDDRIVTLEFNEPYPTQYQVCQFCSNLDINNFSIERLLRILNVKGDVEKYITDILVIGGHACLCSEMWGISKYKAYKIRNRAIVEIQLHWKEIKEEFGL